MTVVRALGFVWLVLGFIAQARSESLQWPPEEIQDLIDGIHGTCTKQVGVSDDEVKNYQISDNSEKMMCYMKCLMIEAKWADGNGNVRYDFIRETSHDKIKDIVTPALDACMHLPGGNGACETYYNFNLCLQKFDPVHWFLP